MSFGWWRSRGKLRESQSWKREKNNWRKGELPSLFIVIHVGVNKCALFKFKTHLLSTWNSLWAWQCLGTGHTALIKNDKVPALPELNSCAGNIKNACRIKRHNLESDTCYKENKTGWCDEELLREGELVRVARGGPLSGCSLSRDPDGASSLIPAGKKKLVYRLWGRKGTGMSLEHNEGQSGLQNEKASFAKCLDLRHAYSRAACGPRSQAVTIRTLKDHVSGSITSITTRGARRPLAGCAPWRSRPHLLPPLLSLSLHSGHTALLVPSGCRAHGHLRTCALTLPDIQKRLLSDSHVPPSVTSPPNVMFPERPSLPASLSIHVVVVTGLSFSITLLVPVKPMDNQNSSVFFSHARFI